jgi:two-component system, cell cycle response regulator
VTSSAGKILVADDQGTSREATARILREAGHRIVLASDGMEALDRAAAERVDVMIVDVVMPRLGGLDVCRAAKQRAAEAGEHLPVLLISARNEPSARVDGLRAGADDFLGKPYDPDELCARIEALLRTRRAFQAAVRQAVAASPDDTSLHDPLTGLHNQRYLMQRIEEEWARAERQSEPLALVALDLDEFDRVNSRFGRVAGDRLLAACGAALVRASRPVDVVTRAGADEFVLILPNTHFSGSLSAAERIWRAVRALSHDEGSGRLQAEASIGVACYPNRDVTCARDLLRFAHAALARAKAEGKGKICLYQHQGYLFQPGS